MDTDADAQLENRHDRELELQRVIDDLVQECAGQSEKQVAARFQEELARLGRTQMPEPWVDAVVDAIALGNAYVVSSYSESHTEIPEPQSRPRNQSIT